MAHYFQKFTKYSEWFKRVKPRKEPRVHPDSPRPDRDWIIMLVVFGLLVVLVGGYSYRLFFTVVHGDLAVHEETNTSIQSLNSKMLVQTVDEYRQRRQEYFGLGGVALPASVVETVISDEVSPNVLLE